MADKKGYRLQIVIDADGQAAIEGIGEVEHALDGIDDTAAKVGRGSSESFGLLAGQVKKVGAALLAIGAIKEFGAYLAEAGMEAEKLGKRLEFAAGGPEQAAAAMRAVKGAASDLGVGVSDLAEAYIRLTNLGLEPSKESLVAYANMAAVSGKSVQDFAEAVADAVTGEFERLKEFGIRASVDGAKVALTFRGHTIQIANDAKTISEALNRIGNTDFAGAAKAQADTAAGALEALEDSFKRFVGMVSEKTGITAAIKFQSQLFKTVTDAAQETAQPLSETARRLQEVREALDYLNATSPAALSMGIAQYTQRIAELTAESSRLTGELKNETDARERLAEAKAKETAASAELQAARARETSEATQAAQAIRDATSAAKADADLSNARMQNRTKLAELDAQAARDAIANGDATESAVKRQIAAERELTQAMADADAVAVRNAQTLAAVAQANLIAAQREVDALSAAKAPAKDLAAAMERLSQAKIASQAAALNADTAALSAMANAAERTRTQLAGVRSAQEALKQAQADQAGKDAAQGWEQAAMAASRAASELQSGDVARATKDIEAGFKTLGDAVRRGDTSAGIQVVQKQLEALAQQAEKTAQAVAKVDDAGKPKAGDGKTDRQDQTRTTDAAKAAKEARSAVEAALKAPIPIALDASASAATAVEQVRSAFAGMQITIPVIAQIIPVGGGGGASGDELAKAAAKVGTRAG